MRRKFLAAGGLVLLALLAGCGFGGPSEIPEDQLVAEGEYQWNTDADVSINLSRSSYTVVVDQTNSSNLSVHTRDALGTESPVDLSNLRFRYANGTVVNASHPALSATRTQSRSEISLPASDGKVAYSASRNGKQFSTPAFVTGSYEVTLPAGTRIGIPLLSQASPGGHETTVEDGLMTVRWANVSRGTVQVRYYLQRDLLLFGGLVAIVVILGAGGALYYFRQIRRLEEQREDVGLEVEQDDDPPDEGPPPGMR